MSASLPPPASVFLPPAVHARAEQLYGEQSRRVMVETDRMFAWLMVAQWLFGIALALTLSPFTYEGARRAVHPHVYAAVFLGGALSALPLLLIRARPGAAATRYVISVAQILWSALLIHLTGGRIETHFHVFGSLAFLAFYRDWRALVAASLVVALDHLARGLYWPASVYGVNTVAWPRFLEHFGWVLFEDIVLVLACLHGVRDMRTAALQQAEVEALSESEREKSSALDRLVNELRSSHKALVRAEKLAAVGQLAASVAHELRNPLATVRNAATYIGRRVGEAQAGAPAGAADPRVAQFLGVIDRELDACARIIGDLLDFARERPPKRQACPLAPLVDEAISVLPASRARVRNDVPWDLPVPALDREQLRQVVINLLQNAIEALPPERADSEVVVRAEGGGGRPWSLSVHDRGSGIPADALSKVFEPLFTTKLKGTGLGLAVVANLVRGHGGTIRVESEEGRGTTFVVELPAGEGAAAA